MSKILFLSSEAFPLNKTGGLADVAGSLPVALQENNQDVRLMLPAYQEILNKTGRKNIIAETYHYGQSIKILETTLPGSHITTWLVDAPLAFDRPGNPYLDSFGTPWSDNALRFALFCQAAVDIALNRCGLNWLADLVHCNDWQTALVPALLDSYPKHPATVFTIHNMAYQGLFNKQTFFDLGLPDELWGMKGVEFYDQFSFIKGGLVYANHISTVSPTYAEEIQHPEFGYGLDGLLSSRKAELSGIINGIDTAVWNPETDNLLAQNYNSNSLSKKTINKTHLQKEFNLPVDKKIPLVGLVSRLVEQKGMESILAAMQELMNMPLQLIILGSGEKHYESAFLDLARLYPEKFSLTIGYDEILSHQIEAAADIYLMPSTFEPCGLNQLYSLRYGTLPLARNVGGLADTVIGCNQETIADKSANGFIVKHNTPHALIETTRYALTIYQNKKLWKQLQLTAMAPDRSWKASALRYIEIYQKAIQNNTGEVNF